MKRAACTEVELGIAPRRVFGSDEGRFVVVMVGTNDIDFSSGIQTRLAPDGTCSIVYYETQMPVVNADAIRKLMRMAGIK